MSYRQFTVTTFRQGYRNVVGLVLVSLLAGLALVPLAATVVVGTVPAVLGGLWTTCLLLGIVTVAAFRFTSVVAERGVQIAARPYVAAGVRHPVPGLALGAVTFAVVLAAAILVGASPEAYRAIASGFAGFLLVAWFLLTAFAAPELGEGQGLVPAIRASADRMGQTPGRVVWFLFISFACALVAGVTVATLVLFLPGVLALLAARASVDANGERSDDRDN